MHINSEYHFITNYKYRELCYFPGQAWHYVNKGQIGLNLLFSFKLNSKK